MAKTTVKSRILAVLKHHPEGLNRNKLFSLIREDFSVLEEGLSSTLALMTREGLVRVEDSENCPTCHAVRRLYKVRS